MAGTRRLWTLAAAALLAAAGAHAQSVSPQDPQAPVASAPTPRAVARQPAPKQGEPMQAAPEPAPVDERWAVHAQSTFTGQFHPAFRSPYRGPNSLDPGARGDETWDVTLFAGLRLWKGLELWVNPEIDQGFGLSNTTGVAAFPSGEAYKVGKASPYYRLQRLFVRQTIDLGGDKQKVDPDQNVLGGSQTADHIVVTFGKFSVGDVFDTNAYAHDPRGDFLNWAIIDTGTFDYAADAWAYTPGLAVEVYKGRWVLRQGLFDLSTEPNSTRYAPRFDQFQMIEEVERDYKLAGRDGKLRVTGWWSRGRMANLSDAIRWGEAHGTTPELKPVRRYQGRAGIGLSLEQQVASDLGVFARAGWADGHQETYEFTEIDRTVAAGLSLKGTRWGRGDDVVGAAVEVADISKLRRAFLAAGGLGVLVGDGRLPRYAPETVLETYYKALAVKPVAFTFDYQFIADPAYARDRGPAHILGGRLHAQF